MRSIAPRCAHYLAHARPSFHRRHRRRRDDRPAGGRGASPSRPAADRALCRRVGVTPALQRQGIAAPPGRGGLRARPASSAAPRSGSPPSPTTCRPRRSTSAAARRPSRLRHVRLQALGRRPGEQQQVAVGIAHDEGARAPRLLLQRSGRNRRRPPGTGRRAARISAALSTVIEAARSSSRSRMSPTKTGSQTRRRLSRALSRLHLAIERRLAVGEDDRRSRASR